MRKAIIACISMVAAALAVLSCAKVTEIEDKTIDPSPAGKSVTIRVLASDDATRTAASDGVDGGVPTIHWVNTDKVIIFESMNDFLNGSATSEPADIDAEGKASFSTTLDWDAADGTSFRYSAVYPAEAVKEDNGSYYLTMPARQTLVGNNFSKDSDLLFSTLLDHGFDRVADGEDVMFSFRRMGTVVRLTLKGITAGEKIRQVTLKAPAYIAGTIPYDPYTSTVDVENAFQDKASDTIVLTLDDLVATGEDVLWFRVMAERDWAAGDALHFKVITDQAVYEKDATLSSEIRFPDGGVTKFGVGLASTRVSLQTVPCLWNFESGADDWMFFDVDGDGYNWEASESDAHSGENILTSASFINNVGALYPDNWAFTPPVQLTEDNYLSFWVRTQDPDWRNEHYAVYITEDTPNADNLDVCEPLMAETVYPSGNVVELGPDSYYVHIVVRIPNAYNGKAVHIGFRHFNCTDVFWLNLDDVAITEGTPELSPVTVTYADYLGRWSTPNGSVDIAEKESGTSYSVSCLIGQGIYPVEAVFSQGQLILYEQVVNTSGNTAIALQGYTDETSPNIHTDFDSVGQRILFRAFPRTDENGLVYLRIISDNNFDNYCWASYDGHTLSGYSDPYPIGFQWEATEYLFIEDFDGDEIGDWAFIDADGDENIWSVEKRGGHSGDYALTSASYINNVGPLTPDNWAFTPPVTLASNNYLSFWVTAQDLTWCAEHYAVYITTTAPTADNLAGCTVLMEEQEYPNGTPVETGDDGYQHFIVTIPSSFDNQTVYIGFRHFNCTDQFYLNIDDVIISDGSPVIGNAPAAAPGRAAVQEVAGHAVRKRLLDVQALTPVSPKPAVFRKDR